MGFTFVEVLFVSLIFVIIGGGLLTMYLTAQTSYLSADAYVQVQQEARRGLDAMVRELREAGNVTWNAGTPQQVDFQIALSYNQAACVGTCWGARDAAGVDQTGWRVRYRMVGGQILREVLNTPTPIPPGMLQTTRVLANNVDGASSSFGWNAGTKVVTVTLQTRVQQAALPTGSQATNVLVTRTTLRNR